MPDEDGEEMTNSITRVSKKQRDFFAFDSLLIRERCITWFNRVLRKS